MHNTNANVHALPSVATAFASSDIVSQPCPFSYLGYAFFWDTAIRFPKVFSCFLILPKQLPEGKGYPARDEFYEGEKGKGSYSLLYTCNSWVNSSFKESNLKACYWTPFDFGLLWKYEDSEQKKTTGTHFRSLR